MEFERRSYDTLDSTQTEARRLIDAGLARDGMILHAREQTAGRGRRGRSWTSAPGDDLAFSMILYPQVPSHFLASLPMVVACAVGEAAAKYDVACRLKWPNDVFAGAKKLAGILTETVGTAGGTAVIVGVGVNVNMGAQALAQVGQPATSLAQACGRRVDPLEVLDAFCETFGRVHAGWERHGFEAVRGLWERAGLYAPGEPVRLRHDEAGRGGSFAGYGREGQLLLKDGSGTVCAVWSAELA